MHAQKHCLIQPGKCLAFHSQEGGKEQHEHAGGKFNLALHYFFFNYTIFHIIRHYFLYILLNIHQWFSTYFGVYFPQFYMHMWVWHWSSTVPLPSCWCHIEDQNLCSLPPQWFQNGQCYLLRGRKIILWLPQGKGTLVPLPCVGSPQSQWGNLDLCSFNNSCRTKKTHIGLLRLRMAVWI